ncbi:YbjN domain-containing protein [Murimonas intestini]|uniref:Sensory transduction regulator n=1 Tax=Murimonas intestini TaxID=1337051 RepID=A0AB73T148_9FIRM|nr:YbjN domain-containing protein [Murimonas intestini]MCR1840382.1 YbjN domain-containing protein [Murimonas intestini]MCR1867507.1 YbjN domain-containing protein [Murimonas intestini]MCR1884694.1 YbjN domain-containing protein [Murimonas intestini]
MDYSKQIAASIVSYFEDNNFHYSFDKERGVITNTFNMEGKLKNIRYAIGVRESDYIVYATVDINADEECRAAVSEFLTRANYGMLFGSFEMDYRDGEIRFRVAVDCDECMPSSAVIRNSIIFPHQAFSKYGNGLLTVMFGVMTPEEAIKGIEG